MHIDLHRAAALKLNQAAAMATTEAEKRRIAEARFKHRIIEAMLTGNIDSLPETPWR